LTPAPAVHANQQAADVVRLLMFTGCCKDEALAGRWSDLDLGNGVCTSPDQAEAQSRRAALGVGAGIVESDARSRRARIRIVAGVRHARRYGHVHRLSIKRAWTAILRARWHHGGCASTICGTASPRSSYRAARRCR
jgi:integrase